MDLTNIDNNTNPLHYILMITWSLQTFLNSLTEFFWTNLSATWKDSHIHILLLLLFLFKRKSYLLEESQQFTPSNLRVTFMYNFYVELKIKTGKPPTVPENVSRAQTQLVERVTQVFPTNHRAEELTGRLPLVRVAEITKPNAPAPSTFPSS